ncbi:MAG: hypothetical protein FWD81_04070 [Methanomassiliicoccaceae archaeon]|nr:hypothetical protein [Methanomassiliicoccaceae archaeon]
MYKTGERRGEERNMKKRVISKEELRGRLLKIFGLDEPILISEIIDVWKEYSRPRVYQLLNEMQDDGSIAKGDPGIYYIPTTTPNGERSVLSRESVIEKRFICHEGDIFGYYSGPTLLNRLGLTTEAPEETELVTSNASAKIRRIKVCDLEIVVRRSKVPINKKNAYALMLLEVFTELQRSLEGDEMEIIKNFVSFRNVKEDDILRNSRYFPLCTLKVILETGLKNIFE